MEAKEEEDLRFWQDLETKAKEDLRLRQDPEWQGITQAACDEAEEIGSSRAWKRQAFGLFCRLVEAAEAFAEEIEKREIAEARAAAWKAAAQAWREAAKDIAEEKTIVERYEEAERLQASAEKIPSLYLVRSPDE